MNPLSPGLALEIARLEVRHNCGRLLFKGHLGIGSYVEIRCPKCGKFVIFDFRAPAEPAEPTQHIAQSNESSKVYPGD